MKSGNISRIEKSQKEIKKLKLSAGNHKDIIELIKLDRELNEEKINELKRLKEESKKLQLPIAADSGKVLYSFGLFKLKKQLGEAEETKGWEYLSRKDKYLLKRKPSSTFIIEMFFSNGTSREFVLHTKEQTFAYRGGLHYINHDDVIFSLSRNQYKLYFHEDYVCPINKEIKLEGDEAYFSTTPSNIKPVIEQEYVKALVHGSDMDKWIKICLIISLLTFILVLFHVLKVIK